MGKLIIRNPEFIKEVCIRYYHKESVGKICRELNTYWEVVMDIVRGEGVEDEVNRLIGDGYNHCNVCMEWKPLSEFHKSSEGRAPRCYCKICRKIKEPYKPEYFLKYREMNKEKIAQSNKAYREKNIEKIKKHKKSTRSKEIKKESDKKYYQKVKKEHTGLLIAMKLRSRLSTHLRKNTNPYLHKFGYSLLELKSHLESKFHSGMTWENYGRGGWNIDHIKPLVYFDLTNNEEIKKAFMLSNIQPLYESDNASKGTLYNGKRLIKKQILQLQEKDVV